MIKAQLDFQQKIENQMSMLQTMMQTVCQLVNNELINNKKCTGNCTAPSSTVVSARSRRDSTDFQMPEPRQNWSNATNNNHHVQKPRNNSNDELMTFTQRMSSGKGDSSSIIAMSCLLFSYAD